MPNFFQQTERFTGFANRNIDVAQIKKAIILQQTCEVSKTIMRSGEGYSSTTLLNRSLNSVTGSRKTSSAL